MVVDHVNDVCNGRASHLLVESSLALGDMLGIDG
ncbi:MAG: hypothetical protein CM1200mP28_17010 [Deltaproteobacteria bacterium]|nr:MAG: hypothetical protein CM1200mP28_17010 [Deltaproteobacteria bacterium]